MTQTANNTIRRFLVGGSILAASALFGLGAHAEAAATGPSGFQQEKLSYSPQSHDRDRRDYRRDRRDDRRDYRRDRRDDRRDTRSDRREDRREYRHDRRDDRRDYRSHRRDHRDYRSHRRDHRDYRSHRRDHRPVYRPHHRPTYHGAHRDHRGYYSPYQSRLGISFHIGYPGYSRYRWAKNHYAFYSPSYGSYGYYRSQTQCHRINVSAWHYDHQEVVSVLQCYNPWDGAYIVEGTEQLISCNYGRRRHYH